jgi:Lon protease-like protein
MSGETLAVPALSAGRLVLFPGMRCAVQLLSANARSAIGAAIEHGDPPLAVFATSLDSVAARDGELVYSVGTLARVVDLGISPCCARPVAELEGTERVRLVDWRRGGPHREAVCTRFPPAPWSTDACLLATALREMIGSIRAQFPRCVHIESAHRWLDGAESPEKVLGAACGLLLHLPTDYRQRMLEIDPLEARLEFALVELRGHLARSTSSLQFN